MKTITLFAAFLVLATSCMYVCHAQTINPECVAIIQSGLENIEFTPPPPSCTRGNARFAENICRFTIQWIAHPEMRRETEAVFRQLYKNNQCVTDTTKLIPGAYDDRCRDDGSDGLYTFFRACKNLYPGLK